MNFTSIFAAVLISSFYFVSCQEKKTTSPYPPYTDKEKLAIKKLRELVLPELYRVFMKTDEFLIRWIRDANFDLNSAQTKLNKAIQWRKDNQIDSILKEDFTFILRQCPFLIKGVDKAGRPLGLLSIGKCDIRKIVLSGKRDQLERFMYYFLELCANAVRTVKYKDKKDVRDAVMLVDGHGFNLRQHGCLRCIPLFLSIFTLYENYYPDYLDKMYLINVPRVALPILDIILQVLSPKTKKIIEIYGFERNEWEKSILKNIEPNQLPRQFGGSIK